MLENLKAFFAEAKSEFKKISWPTWDEIKGSTAVVCVTILFLMIVLWVYDFGIISIAGVIGKIFK